MNERKFDGNDIVYDAATKKVVRVSVYAESVMQTVKSVLSTFMGECFTNPEAGVPWFDEILGQDTTFSDYAQQVIKEKILEVPGVSKVVSSSLKIDGRNLSGGFTITLDNGETMQGEF